MSVQIDRTPYTFHMVRRVDVYRNSAWEYELGIFKPDPMFSHLAPEYIGVYRPAFKDYLLVSKLEDYESYELDQIEMMLKLFASIETHDEAFALMNDMIDHLKYHPILKETPMWINTNDSQYNLLGAMMSVNNRLLLGGCGVVDLDETRTPWTIGAMVTGSRMWRIIKFHEALLDACKRIAEHKWKLAATQASLQ